MENPNLNIEPMEKEEERSKEEENGPECFGARHTLALMGFLIITSSYSMRVNLSVAIVAMVNNTKSADELLTEACPLPGDDDPEDSTRPEGEFDWSEKTQGAILGSFFYGYCLTNILGGRAAEYWGGRIVAGWSVILTGVLTMLSPIVANYSTGLFIAVRVLEGCISAVIFPSLNTLIASWYPTRERSKFAATIFAGLYSGTVLGLLLTGWLCATDFFGGWPSAFYVLGFFGVVCGVLWLCLITDDPRHHPRISAAELNYILKGCPDTKDRPPVPWKSILTSKYVWTIAIMHFSKNWAFYTFLTELPTYLDRIIHINIDNNGLFSALPYFGGWLFSIIFSLVADKLIASGRISILFLRKIAMIIGDYSVSLGLITLCFISCHSVWAIVTITLCQALNASSNCGYMCSHADISPRFAGTLLGLTNTFATIPGFIAPMVTGILTQGRQTLWAWRTVFLIAALIDAIGVTIYITFITTEVQPWDSPQYEKRANGTGVEDQRKANQRMIDDGNK